MGKARSLLLCGAPETCLTREGSGLTHKNETRLERLAIDKRSSFFEILQISVVKSFITLTPVDKTVG